MTLTQAASTFRTTIKFSWLIIFVPIIVRIILGIVTATSPPPPAPPPTYTAAYGQLPPLVIENQEVPLSTPTFRLDLIDAVFPGVQPVIGVYPILSAPYGFLSRDRAREMGSKLGFSDEPQIIDNREMLWRNGLRTLRLNISNLNFQYTYNYLEDLAVLARGRLTNENFIYNQAGALLNQVGVLGGERGPDLGDGDRSLQLLQFDGTKLIPSTTIIQSHAARVDYFRIPIGEIPVVTPNYYQSNVNVTIATVTLDINYTYWVFDRTNVATYPIKSGEEAYALFEQDFEKYLVFLGQGNNPAQDYTNVRVTQFTTREASLGYYDTATYQQYLQPVWVFRGRAIIETGTQLDFVAYVPAIQDIWIQ